MAAKTVAEYQALLVKTDAAIEAILEGAQSATAADGRTVTRADLAKLIQYQKYLEDRIDRADKGTRRVAEF